MRKKYGIKSMIFILITSSLLAGCKFVRQPDIEKINFQNKQGEEPEEGIDWENLPSPDDVECLIVEDGDTMDVESIVEYFYKESKEKLLTDGYFQNDNILSPTDIYGRKNGVEISFAEKSGMENNGIYVRDMRELAAKRYEAVLEDKFLAEEISKGLTDMYPRGELESCSSEEAIAACAPFAKACGYEDAQVDVFVMKKEVLNNFIEEAHIDVQDINFSAPDPSFDISVIEKIDEAYRAGNYELYFELQGELHDFGDRIEWTDRTEAYLLVYRPVLNNYLLECRYYRMICVYVPSFERIVYASGYQPLVVKEILESETLISAQDAVAEMMRVKNIQSMEDITVTDVSIVYAPRYEKIAPELEERILEPCWRIDYKLSEKILENNPILYASDDGTILINALDGKESTLS